jgi:hypothetical protein
MYNFKTYRYMKKVVRHLRKDRDDAADPKRKLRRSYDDKVGVFPCRSFNFGEQTVTVPHVDQGNLAQSWCSITALGHFDPNTGGHLVLWDYGLAVRFPPGSTILIPSSLLIHSNTSIKKGETRYSIVQYAAGGLFRWAERGFISEKEWLSKATEEDVEKDKRKQERRWIRASKMFTKVEELL